MPPAPVPGPAPDIQWHVDNRFRLFDTSGGTGATVADNEGKLLDVLAGKTVAQAYDQYIPLLVAKPDPAAEPDTPDQGDKDPAFFLHTHYDRIAGQYDAGYVKPDTLTVDVGLSEPQAEGTTCVWTTPQGVQAIGCDQTVPVAVTLDPATFAGDADVSVVAPGGGRATTHIHTQDRLVLAFGDSYGAGEGSPDQPADLSRLNLPAIHRQKGWGASGSWWIQPGVLPQDASADWWSPECHRSLLSAQALTAMKMAADDAHDSVTFVSFACTGAAVLDGLLTPQASPPGQERIVDGLGREGDAAEFSQLERAMKLLCAEAGEDTEINLPGVPNRDTGQLDMAGNVGKWQKVLYTSANDPHDSRLGKDPEIPHCKTWIRHPDVVLLTMGGNDVGFAGLGQWGLTSPTLVKGWLGRLFGASANRWASAAAYRVQGDFASWNGLALVCPGAPYGGPAHEQRCHPPFVTETNSGGVPEFMNELPSLMAFSKLFLNASGLIDKGHTIVVHAAYPDPVFDQNGDICGKVGTHEGDLDEPWDSLQGVMLQKKFIRDSGLLHMHPALGAAQAQVIANVVSQHPGITAPTLNQTLAATDALPLDLKDNRDYPEAEGPGTEWRTAPEPADFHVHGVCAGGADINHEFGFPRPLFVKGAQVATWDPAYTDPAGWDPYDGRRQRWLRTTNDSILTEAISVGGTMTAESISGMIHPTARGYAGIADSFYATVTAPAPVAAPVVAATQP